MTRTPLLHRDDPDRAPLGAHIKVTRDDWLAMARDALVRGGVETVKILPLARTMGVSRSSFYWYFGNRDDLLSALLEEWEARGTKIIAEMCARPADEITEAVCNFFRCFLDPKGFDAGLDFAVREWARRDESLRARVDTADAARIEAVTAMFARYSYAPPDADARARILYFMQLGYHALDMREAIQTRLKRIEPYLVGFIGSKPKEAAMQAFVRDVQKLDLD